MIDFLPNIQETERKANVSDTIDYLEKSNNNFDALNEYEEHSPNQILQHIEQIFNIKSKSNNFNLYDEEIKIYGDILNYESQNLRLKSIKAELETISEALNIMMYGKLLTNEEAEEEDEKLFKDLRKKGQANATNLYYLSKLLALTNTYLDNIEKHIEVISNINCKIHQHTLKDRHSIISNDDADYIQYESKNDLSDQLNTINFVSDKFVIKNYLCDIYNKIISYSVARNSFKKINGSIDMKYDLLSKKENDLKKSFEDAINVMEYTKYQNDAYTDILYERSNLIESFYEYDN